MSERRFAGYLLHRLLGRGASASVVEAEAPDGHRVALKIPHAHAQGDHLDREAERAMLVQSPWVVGVQGVVREGRDRALVLELVRGESLEAAMARGRLDAASIERLAADLAAGLAAIHAAADGGVTLALVHGDVSPSNVLLDERGRAKLTDLGLSRRRALSAVSHSGLIQGTIGYVAPEVVRGSPVTAAADVFAMGVVVQELLTGTRAFPGRTDIERLRATVEVPLEVPPGPLAEWVRACTQKRPERRPADGSEAARALGTASA